MKNDNNNPTLTQDGPILSVRDLMVKYSTYRQETTALDKVSLNIGRSEIIAVVGESGCGKSTLGFSIIGLLQKPPAKVESGAVVFQGRNLLSLKESEMTQLRGTGISMIFQEPLTSLDPVYTVGQQIMEAIDVRESRRRSRNYGPYLRGDATEDHQDSTGNLSKVFIPTRSKTGYRRHRYSDEVLETLKKVQIPDPERVVDKHPHQLSGGMCQRIVIARALAERPSLLIADEPTSTLDVTNQAQMLSLMRDLRDSLGSSILFITHDLAVAAQIADRIAVMYAGKVVEVGDVNDIFATPLHPYTEGLIRSFPQRSKAEGELEAISGEVPDLRRPPPGCRFHPRCKYAFSRCPTEVPELVEVSKNNHQVACFLREVVA